MTLHHSSQSAPVHSLKIGCGEWGFRNRPMREHFEIAAEFGFRELEFGIGGNQPGRLSENPDAREISDFTSLASAFGIATPGCCVENDFTFEDAARHKAEVQKVISQARAAAQCGAKQLRVFAGFTPCERMNESIWKQLLSALTACDAEALKLGMTLAIETHGAIRFEADGSAVHLPTVTTDRAGIARLLAELPERVGFNYDPGNIRAADPEDSRFAVDLLAGRITYCHLKDWTRFGDGWRAVAVGDPENGINFAQLLPQTRYAGTYLIEYEPLSDTREGIARSLAHLRTSGFQLLF